MFRGIGIGHRFVRILGVVQDGTGLSVLGFNLVVAFWLRARVLGLGLGFGFGVWGLGSGLGLDGSEGEGASWRCVLCGICIQD